MTNRRRVLMMVQGPEDLRLNDILTLDGIQNTRSGHDSNSTKLEDLSGNNHDFTVKSGGSVVWGQDHVAFNGVRKALVLTKFSIGTLSKMTIEFVAITKGDGGYVSGNTNAGVILLNGPSTTSASGVLRFQSYRAYSNGILSDNGVSSFYSNQSNNNLGYISGMSSIRYMAYVFTGSKVYRYRNGTLYTGTNPSNITFPNGTPQTLWAIGNSYNTDGIGFNGYIYRIGISSKEMTAEEISERYAYFKRRFSMP